MSHLAPEKPKSLVVHYLGMAERVVLTLIAVVLVVLAVLLLVSNVLSIANKVIAGAFDSTVAIEILDGVLLVMMTMEIVYTVTLSLESHKLVAEPFLVIGIIAAIRRTLVITATSSNFEKAPNQEFFRSTLLELGLLAFIVGVLAAAIYVIRRAPRDVEEEEAEKAVATD